jgi:hypothetical protein
MRSKVFGLRAFYQRYAKLPVGERGVVSINPTHVESLKSYLGGTQVRMASGTIHLTAMKKREVLKLLGARQR